MKRLHSLFLATALSATALQGAIFTVDLGSAGDFAVLSKTGITTTSGSTFVGDLGVSPGPLSSITGFDLTNDSSEQFATSAMVTGRIYAASFGGSTETMLTTAVGDMEAAYTDAAGRVDPDSTNLKSGLLNGDTIAPGVHKWTTDVTITSSITIDGGGDSNAVWIFQIDKRLSLASSANVILSNGANASNIFWQTAEGATLGTNSHFEGTILTMTDIAAETDASMNARLLAQTAVTFDSNSLTGVSAVPEPSTYAAILGFGVLGFVGIRRRMKQVA